jgi:hypothetical protein
LQSVAAEDFRKLLGNQSGQYAACIGGDLRQPVGPIPLYQQQKENKVIKKLNILSF